MLYMRITSDQLLNVYKFISIYKTRYTSLNLHNGNNADIREQIRPAFININKFAVASRREIML